jgi:hypothetical protein
MKLNEDMYFSNTLSIKTPPVATWLLRVTKRRHESPE